MIHPVRILYPRSVGVKIRFASRLESSKATAAAVVVGQCRCSAKARVFIKCVIGRAIRLPAASSMV